MKKAIERLEEAKHAALNCSLSAAVSCIEEAISELKAPPRWETPEQWEKRTGRQYPETAPVYEMRFFDKPLGTTAWICHGYEFALRDKKKYPKRMTHNIILIADDKGSPPDNWRPEEQE